MATLVKWTQLFPTKGSFTIFIVYMALFINQGLLMLWSQNSQHGYSYDTKAAVLLTEVVKLMMTLALCTTDLQRPFEDHRTIMIGSKSIFVFFNQLLKHRKMFVYYMIPAVLYCLYNNLSYANMTKFDPTTYFLLLQFRVVVTGVVFQAVFKKKLSFLQWTSLLLLTLGCMVKELDFGGAETHPFSSSNSSPSRSLDLVGLFLILVQVFASSSAGVYNEYIFKSPENASINLMIQNACLYWDSILCNGAAMLLFGDCVALDAFMQVLADPVVLLLVINNAAVGIVTSFFLSQLNSIVKTYASALELMFSAVLCYIFFGLEIRLNTLITIGIVTGSTFMYAMCPVVEDQKEVGVHTSKTERV